MTQVREGLYYSREHEWVQVMGNRARIGITDYAQESLGDIVFADGEPVGSVVMTGAVAGAVESVKAASDLYSPLSGTIEEINPDVQAAPERINSAPYDSWILEITVSDPAELDLLMDASSYEAFCASLDSAAR